MQCAGCWEELLLQACMLRRNDTVLSYDDVRRTLSKNSHKILVIGVQKGCADGNLYLKHGKMLYVCHDKSFREFWKHIIDWIWGNVGEMLGTCCWLWHDFRRIDDWLSVYWLNLDIMLRKCWKDVERMLREGSENVERMVRECWENVERVFRECWENVDGEWLQSWAWFQCVEV